MNNFKKMLRQNTTKLIDEKIQLCIYVGLKSLECSANIDEYKIHISESRTKILSLLNNFDDNMEILEDRKRFPPSSKTNNTLNNTTILDSIIKDNINKSLSEMLNHISSSSSIDFNKESSQIIDRQLRIGELLDNYEEYIKIIEEENERKQKFAQEQILR